MVRLDVLFVFHKGRKQGFVGKDIDAPHQSVGGFADELDGRTREDVGATVAGRAHAEQQISFDHRR